MLYLNQLEYGDVPYPTNLNNPESDYARNGDVAKAGCGLCSLCMVVDRLTLEKLPLTECRDLSVSAGANHEPGTDMSILGAVIAGKYGLRFQATDDEDEMAACLHSGGAAIINTAGDRDGHIGTFSDIGHYIVAISEADGEFALLDPSWRPDKYTQEPRRSLVRQAGTWLYACKEVIREDTRSKSHPYYLFSRLNDRRNAIK